MCIANTRCDLASKEARSLRIQANLSQKAHTPARVCPKRGEHASMFAPTCDSLWLEGGKCAVLTETTPIQRAPRDGS